MENHLSIRRILSPPHSRQSNCAIRFARRSGRPYREVPMFGVTVAFVTTSLSVVAVLLTGVWGRGITPTASASQWGDILHAAEHFDNLYSFAWFQHLETAIRKEAEATLGAGFALGAVLLQTVAGSAGWISRFHPAWLAPVAVLAGLVVAFPLHRLLGHVSRQAAARKTEQLASTDIQRHPQDREAVTSQLGKWFSTKVGRDPSLGLVD